MIYIQTLQDLKDHDMGLFAHCRAPFAGHGAALDIDMLIKKFGSGYVFINDRKIGAACVCRKCGFEGAELRVQVLGGPNSAH